MRAKVALGFITGIILILVSIPQATAAPPDLFGMEVDNVWTFEGTYQGPEAQITNPGFESGSAGWDAMFTAGTIYKFTINSDAYEGLRAAKLTVTNDGYCMLLNQQPIPISRSGTYTLSLYAKVSGNPAHLTIGVWKGYDPNAPLNIPVGYIHPDAFSGQYELHQLNVVLSAGEYIRLELGINNGTSGPSSVMFDKVQLANPSGSYTLDQEVTSTDSTTFSPVTTLVVESKINGTLEGKEWFETTSGELKLWGLERGGDFLGFSNGLVMAWYPVKVNDQRYSSATLSFQGVPINVSMRVDVLAKESLALGFDSLDAYKARYRFRLWGYGMDSTMTFYYWLLPYLGRLKYQDQGRIEELVSFAIAGGTITQDTDTDSDGLKDYQEIVIHNTDPNNPETDGDGLIDGDEVNIYGTNPLEADTDNDGLNDGDEVNVHGTDPLDADTDDDGLNDGDEITHTTDPLNPDTDGDLMPDGWEVTYGLDPLVDDASADPDGDGYTNLQEYNLGRHPNNYEPDKPDLLSPPNADTDLSLTPTLMTDAFSDTDGDAHVGTRWQVSRVQGDFSAGSLLMDALSDSHLTSFTLPYHILAVDTAYYWRAKFQDDRNASSEWSDEWAFHTLLIDPRDPNADGVPDDQEMLDPNVDLDGDTTPDMNQADMKCVNAVIGGAQVSVKQGTNVASIHSLSSVDPATIADMQNRPDEMPIGLISFRITVNNPGDTAEMKIYFSTAVPKKWFKWDPVNGWQDYTNHASFSADRKSVTLQLTDGGMGDADGVANRTIVDPSGPGGPAALSADGDEFIAGGGGGGGCLISIAGHGFRGEKGTAVLAFVVVFGLIGLAWFGIYWNRARRGTMK